MRFSDAATNAAAAPAVVDPAVVDPAVAAPAVAAPAVAAPAAVETTAAAVDGASDKAPKVISKKPSSLSVNVISWTGEIKSQMTLSRKVFGEPLRRDILQRCVEYHRAKRRKGESNALFVLVSFVS